MTTWPDAREKLHKAHPRLKEEYDRLGPRFAALSKLIDARERLKVSQSELARRMDVPANVVSRLESAQHSPRLDTLVDYANALGYEFNVSLRKRAPVGAETRGRRRTAEGHASRPRPASGARRQPAAPRGR